MIWPTVVACHVANTDLVVQSRFFVIVLPAPDVPIVSPPSPHMASHKTCLLNWEFDMFGYEPVKGQCAELTLIGNLQPGTGPYDHT
jgi:hypothetical protein